jgi:hypothetical protein
MARRVIGFHLPGALGAPASAHPAIAQYSPSSCQFPTSPQILSRPPGRRPTTGLWLEPAASSLTGRNAMTRMIGLIGVVMCISLVLATNLASAQWYPQQPQQPLPQTPQAPPYPQAPQPPPVPSSLGSTPSASYPQGPIAPGMPPSPTPGAV